MLIVFAMKSAIKEHHHSKYHYQMVFHITVLSNILTDMTRMPLGTLGIKFRDSKMFIRRNRLNRLMSHKLKYTNQTILYAFIYLSAEIPYRVRNRHIYISTTYLLLRYCPDRFLTMGLKTRLIGLLKLFCLSALNSVFSTLHIETNPVLYVASSSECLQKCP